MSFKTASLPDPILSIMKNQATERPFSGEYNHFENNGTYLCRQCGLPLYRSQSKFYSMCGWPSFDEGMQKAIIERLDKDGLRSEILCTRCSAHLGHVFSGEGLTNKNKRYCVNSLSLDFVQSTIVQETEEAILAAGCFWGVEQLMQQLPGILKTEVGYTGGCKKFPTYEEVCTGLSGHYEAIRVLFDPQKLSYEQLIKYFFEIHDMTQSDGQGPDIGSQYLSAIFYYDAQQKSIALNILDKLEKLGYRVVTKLLPVTPFWRAETDHQNYYQKNRKQAYCHHYQKKFIS